MKIFLSSLCAALVFLQPSLTRADDKTHRAAAESLLGLMNMETLLSQSVNQMLDMQIKQNPAIAPFQQEMKDFFGKYMSWPVLKDDMVSIYMGEFTEPELNELNKFYQTPVGKKSIQRMPALLAKGSELGQKRVQEHLPELQAAIAAKSAAAAPAAPSPAKKTP